MGRKNKIKNPDGTMASGQSASSTSQKQNEDGRNKQQQKQKTQPGDAEQSQKQNPQQVTSGGAAQQKSNDGGNKQDGKGQQQGKEQRIGSMREQQRTDSHQSSTRTECGQELTQHNPVTGKAIQEQGKAQSQRKRGPKQVVTDQQQLDKGQHQRHHEGNKQDERGAPSQQQTEAKQGVSDQQRQPEQPWGRPQQFRNEQQQRPHGGNNQDRRGASSQQNIGAKQVVSDQQRRPENPWGQPQQFGKDQQQRPHGGNNQDTRRAPSQQQTSAKKDVSDQQRRPEQPGGQPQQFRYEQQQRPHGGNNQDRRGASSQQNIGAKQVVSDQQRGPVRAMGKAESIAEHPLPVKEKSCNGIVRGTLGTPGIVEVNYLRLNLDKMPNEAYHYDVTISPDRPKKFLRPAFEQFAREVFPNVILSFDGFKNCYSMERLKSPIEQTIQVVDSGNRMKEFVVKFQETDNCVVDLDALRNYQTERVFDKPMRALQVLEVVLASANHERGIRVGRSFFRRPLNAFDLEDGYEAWTGLFQAAILGELPLLNVDIAHKSFPCESTLLSYLDNMRVDKTKDLRNNNYLFRDISNYLIGINILYTPPKSFNAVPKQYKVIGIGEPASMKKFKTDDGNETTVSNYFRSKGFTLQYPNLNCLTVGSTIRQISLPMELCSIPGGQVSNKKDQSRQVEKMIRFAATSTNTRKQKIMDLLSYFHHNQNHIIESFGLSIGGSFLKVPTRLLPSPSLEYLQQKTVRTFKGAWRMEGVKFLNCANPPNGHRWAIIYEESRGPRGINYHDLEEFKTLVIKTSQGLNMKLQNTAEITTYRIQELQGMLKNFAKNNFDLVFVVLTERGTAYAKIKQIAELDVGILTQCIKDKTIFRTKKDFTVFSNILLKVNGKLNGTNHKIAQDRSNLLSPIKRVMYLGADVTHPSPDQRDIPSVVGVAASHDPYGACYNCQYRLQRSTVENIEDMESIAARHLEVYFQYQNSYPEQIIYYRDGVSDGQFPIVEKEEIRAIKRACARKQCNPKLTCVIVVKRHHTRFFPLTNPQHDRDFNNVQAGTVVDQYITHPNEVQFFMVSHQSIQGTARPTRYNVIMDESKFDINLLQKLTYDLCHLFPRCNRAVSYPAPAYLAHLVAFRGRVYLEGTQRFNAKNLKSEYDRRQIKPHFMNKNPMYFI